MVVIFKDSNQGADITEIAKYTKSQTSINSKATAYVCINYACLAPTTDKSKMLNSLKPRKRFF
jgi:hypothetical protein